MTAAGAVVWTALALATLQSPPAPQRRPPPATGLIVGRVVDGTSGRPIAGAVVTLGSPGADPNRPRAMTNANGQFVFRKLAAGIYDLVATRPGYVDGAPGRRRPSAQSTAVKLNDADRLSDVVIPMWKHATINGTVTDESGDPMIGVQLRAFLRRYAAGRLRLVPGPTATTDDRGIYRMASLTPGDYVVAFVWRETSVPVATAELLRAPPTGDAKAQEILRERFSLSTGFSSGPGVQVGGSVRDLNFAAPVPPPATDESGLAIYPTQFYPGVPSAARAGVITLASGQQREGIDFTLAPLKTVRVSGTLMGADGPVPNVSLRLVPSTDEMLVDLEASLTMTGAGGEFTLLGVPPGQYTIKVLRTPRPPTPTSSTNSMTQIQMGSTMVMTSMGSPAGPSGPPPIPDDPTLFAEAPVSVGNRDVTGVFLSMQRGARITGRFEFDGTRERPDTAALTRISVSLDRADATPPAFAAFSSIPPGRADETGAFKTYGVVPGRYVVRIGAVPGGWTVKSVMSEGRDVSEQPLDLRSTDVGSIVVTFTDRPTKLTGVARNATGNADPDALVVVFPPDTGAWSEYGLSPRRMRSAHTAKDGSYTFTGLPSGDYYVTAIHEENIGQWQDPRVLEELARGATQVRLADGDTRTQDLKTAKGGGQ